MLHYSTVWSLCLDSWRPGWTNLYYHLGGRSTPETANGYVHSTNLERNKNYLIQKRHIIEGRKYKPLSTSRCSIRSGLKSNVWTSQVRKGLLMTATSVKFPPFLNWLVVIWRGHCSSETLSTEVYLCHQVRMYCQRVTYSYWRFEDLHIVLVTVISLFLSCWII